MKLIGLCGYKGAGKSTVAEAAINLYGNQLPKIQRIGFADPMAEMLVTMGVDRETMRDKSKWNDPLPILSGKSIRHAMVTLGTEWGREHLGADVWTNITLQRAADFDGVTIIDNVRFVSEAEGVIGAGGNIVHFDRADYSPDLSHSSEQFIKEIDLKFCRYYFKNPGDQLESTAGRFAELLHYLIEGNPPFG